MFENYYPRVFLIECVYCQEKKYDWFISDKLKISFDESDVN